MASSSPQLFFCLSVCLSVWIHGPHLTAGKVSDACHGNKGNNQTHNILQCEEGTEICITEVRYYQGSDTTGCTYVISAPVQPSCCEHNDSRCSWIREESDHWKEFQSTCSGKRRCDLHSGGAEVTPAPCINPFPFYTVSSVRSITYICITKGSCPPIPTTTGKSDLSDISTTIQADRPTSVVTTERLGQPLPDISTPRPTDRPKHLVTTERTGQLLPDISTPGPTGNRPSKTPTGAIVGGVLGVVPLTFIVIAVVIFLRRRSEGRLNRAGGTKSDPQITPNEENPSEHPPYEDEMDTMTSEGYINMTMGPALSRESNTQQHGPIPAVTSASPALGASEHTYQNMSDETSSANYYNVTGDLANNTVYDKIRHSAMTGESTYTALSR